MSKVEIIYYLGMDEDYPVRKLKRKLLIPKIMFLAAVSRPIFDPNKKMMFDGRIGIWEFIEQVAEKRNSKNSLKSEFETKPILSITSDVYRHYMINQVLPEIN